MTALKVRWVECQKGWCSFEGVDLEDVTAHGVYIIWYNGNPGRVVRLGQGDIADRLKKHRRDKKILAYQEQGLLVTWAKVPARDRDGVERYLADHYPPLIGDAFPDVEPIAVNSPWS